MTAMTELSEARCEMALTLVAQFLGEYYGDDGQMVPTGEQAARHALGPQLVMDWEASTDWPACPTILLEGAGEWAYYASEKLRDQMLDLGIHTEVWASYALQLYPAS